MTVKKHRLPARVFTALAEGGGGPDAVRRLASVRNSRNRLLVHMLAEAADTTGPTTAAIVREAYRTLISLEQQAPHAVDFVLNYPGVSAWLLNTALQLHRGELTAVQPARLAAVAAAVAVRASVNATIDIPAQSRVDDVLRLPSLGATRLPAGPVHLISSPDLAVLVAAGKRVEVSRVPHQKDDTWSVLRRVSAEHAGLRLDLLMDGWEHGPMGGSTAVDRHDLDQEEIDQWQTVLSAGWRLLVSHHRDVAAEVAAAHSMLVPLRTRPGFLASSTPSDAFGCVAMSLPTCPRTAALILAHEVQHAKLSVLTDLFPLVESTDQEKFYAPWRPDPRPAFALLHGIYAHLGVTAFWRTQRGVERNTIKAEVEFARWRSAAHEAALILVESGLLSPIGAQFVTGIMGVLETWRSDGVSDTARTAALHMAERHRERWRQRLSQY